MLCYHVFLVHLFHKDLDAVDIKQDKSENYIQANVINTIDYYP